MMIKSRIVIAGFLVIIACLYVTVSLYSQQNQKMLVRIKPSQHADLEKLRNLDLDYATEVWKEQIDVIIDQTQLETIKNLGFEYEVLPPISKANLYDPEYHTYEETVHELDSLHQAYPAITSLHRIGVSEQYRIPIWAIKISDNAEIDEDEFTVLYDGVHHAREPIGLESCMVLINHLLSNYGVDPKVTEIVDNIETWVIPIINTEGYKYLVDNDLSSPWWRKNQRDNNQNRHFDPDYDGVDLNRNYDYYFTSGGSSDPSSWVYRGPQPFSESEIAAKRDLVLRERFLCSVTYHSYGEIIFYMRGLENSIIPETNLLDSFANAVASRIPRLPGFGHYDTGGSTFSTNMSYPWMFAVAGVYEVLIETGTEFIPPGSIALKVANDNLPGAMYLLEKTIAGPGIRGHVTNATTGEPVAADVKILEYFTAGMTPRKSEAGYGRFHRFAAPGTYTLEVSAQGFKPKTVSNVMVKQTGWTDTEIPLEGEAIVLMNRYFIDDDSTGQSLGNGDSVVNINETIEFQINLKNFGKADVDSVVAQLVSLHPYAAVIQGNLTFGAISAGSVVSSEEKYVFQVDPRTPDKFELPFKLQITGSNGMTREQNFVVTVSAPVLDFQKVVIHDSLGNNNGACEPGETVDLEVIIANNGRMDATLVHSQLFSSTSYIDFIDQTDTIKIIESRTKGSLFFRLKLSPSAPDPYFPNFNLIQISRENYIRQQAFTAAFLSGFFDDMEYSNYGWSHEVIGNPINDHDDWQWGQPQGGARGQDPTAAYSGSQCWGNDLGGEGWDGYYQHNVNICLNSPVINCNYYSNVGLKFMRWLTIEQGDTASILVNDQVVWTSPADGLHDKQWTQQIVDISAIADGNPNVVISFGLTSNESGAAGGWNIDDVMVKHELMTEVITLANQNPADDYYLFQNYPNPFNSTTTIRYKTINNGKIILKIFNLLGQEVCQLLDKEQPAGCHSVSWDGKDISNRDVASGIYLLSFEVKDKNNGTVNHQIRKMILVR